jgi:predicted nucleotidyltransferase
MALLQRTSIDGATLAAFCERSGIARLEEFDPRYAGFPADLHLLATNTPDAEWSLFDHTRVEQELAALLGRSVELVTRGGVESNPLAPSGILETARPFSAG